MKSKILAIAGPTASGKTALSIELAKRYNGEIVSCDSMQIYKGMNIGTAKPTEEEKQGIPHYMIDIISPNDNFSVAEYVNLAREYIDDILRRGKLPILTGGTGLYLDSVINNTKFSDAKEDADYRESLYDLAGKEGNGAVHKLLEEIDPLSAEKIHENNLRRVIRALEIYKTTGKTMTQVNIESERESLYDALIIGIDMDRELLYERINKRVDIMLDHGLLDEIKALMNKGFDKSSTAFQAIGYKEFISYFEGEISFPEAVDKVKQESRRYAKRQMTWFRRNENINWIVLQNDYSYDKIVKNSCMLTDKFGIIKNEGVPYEENSEKA
ncbi:MAG: tRNA (adenosine(37)-N6)-dimethylallyltransferase MiaA [Clostridia bacterium]|nr:tRNA (adenosine(37)-N6)-dimethylallyltransferase MiaA [Clostridia bacterium]